MNNTTEIRLYYCIYCIILYYLLYSILYCLTLRSTLPLLELADHAAQPPVGDEQLGLERRAGLRVGVVVLEPALDGASLVREAIRLPWGKGLYVRS